MISLLRATVFCRSRCGKILSVELSVDRNSLTEILTYLLLLPCRLERGYIFRVATLCNSVELSEGFLSPVDRRMSLSLLSIDGVLVF